MTTEDVEKVRLKISDRPRLISTEYSRNVISSDRIRLRLLFLHILDSLVINSSKDIQ